MVTRTRLNIMFIRHCMSFGTNTAANPERKYHPPKPETIRHRVSFIISLSTEALSHTNPTTAGLFRDSWCVQGHDKKDTGHSSGASSSAKVARFI